MATINTPNDPTRQGLDEQVLHELGVELARLRAQPHATSLHELYVPMCDAAHAFHTAGVCYEPDRARWRAGMRAAAIHLAAVALRAIEDWRLAPLESKEQG